MSYSQCPYHIVWACFEGVPLTIYTTGEGLLRSMYFHQNSRDLVGQSAAQCAQVNTLRYERGNRDALRRERRVWK